MLYFDKKYSCKLPFCVKRDNLDTTNFYSILRACVLLWMLVAGIFKHIKVSKKLPATNRINWIIPSERHP